MHVLCDQVFVLWFRRFLITHHALVGFLPRVDSHVNEQLVAGVEGLVAANAAGPEAREVLAFALVDVDLLNVPHKLLLLLVCGAAVYPATHLLIGQRSSSSSGLFPLGDSLRAGGAPGGRFESQGRARCRLLALVVQQAPVIGRHVLVQVIGGRHGGAREVLVGGTETPADVATHVMVTVIVVVKEFVLAGRKIVQGLLLEGSPGSLAPIQERPGFRARMQHPRHQAEEPQPVRASPHTSPGCSATYLQHGALVFTQPLALPLLWLDR